MPDLRTASRTPRARALLQNLGLLVVSVLIAVAVMELTLRLAYYGSPFRLSGEHSLRVPHPTRGWALDPGGEAFQRTRDYAIAVHINDQGLRDRPHQWQPAPGVTRIVILGDSFMEAYQVELEDSLPYRLQERLADRGVEAINLGVGGYGTAQELLVLREQGLRYRPDIVVLAFFPGNDVQNNSRALQRVLWGAEDVKVFGRPFARVTDLTSEIEWQLPDPAALESYAEEQRRKRSALGRRILRNLDPSILGNALARGLRLATRDDSEFDPEAVFGWAFLRRNGLEAEWDEAWLVTRRLLLELARETEAAGARFAILVVPAKFQVEDGYLAAVRASLPGRDFDATRINRALAEFAAAHGIALLDPTEAFRARDRAEPGSLFYAIEDRHWTPAGHALATEKLIAFLDARGWLPPRTQADSAPSSTSR